MEVLDDFQVIIDSALSGQTITLLSSLTLPSGCTITGTDVTISGKGLVSDTDVHLHGVKLDTNERDGDSISITAITVNHSPGCSVPNIASTAVNGNATGVLCSVSVSDFVTVDMVDDMCYVPMLCYVTSVDWETMTVTAEKGNATGISYTITSSDADMTDEIDNPFLILSSIDWTMTVTANDGDAVGVTAVTSEESGEFPSSADDNWLCGVRSWDYIGTITVTATDGNATGFLCPAGNNVDSPVSYLHIDSFNGILTAASNQTATGISAKYFGESATDDQRYYFPYPSYPLHTGIIIADGKNADTCAISTEKVYIYVAGVIAAGNFKTMDAENGMADFVAGLQARDESVIQKAAAAEKFYAVRTTGSRDEDSENNWDQMSSYVCVQSDALIFGDISMESGEVTISTKARMYGNLDGNNLAVGFAIKGSTGNAVVTVTEDGIFGTDRGSYNIYFDDDVILGDYTLISGLSDGVLTGKEFAYFYSGEYKLTVDGGSLKIGGMNLNLTQKGSDLCLSIYGTETPSLTVTTDEDVLDLDDGVVSLREALLYATSDSSLMGADGKYTVTFDPSLNGKTLEMKSPLVVSEDVVIDGKNLAVSVQGDSSENTSYGYGVFVKDNTALALSDLTLAVQSSDAWYLCGIIAGNLDLQINENTVISVTQANRHNDHAYGVYCSDGYCNSAHDVVLNLAEFKGKIEVTSGTTRNIGIYVAGNYSGSDDYGNASYLNIGVLSGMISVKDGSGIESCSLRDSANINIDVLSGTIHIEDGGAGIRSDDNNYTYDYNTTGHEYGVTHIGTMSGLIDVTGGTVAVGIDSCYQSVTIDTLSGTILAEATAGTAAGIIGRGGTIGTMSGLIDVTGGTVAVGIDSYYHQTVTIDTLSGTIRTEATAGTATGFSGSTIGTMSGLIDVKGGTVAVGIDSYYQSVTIDTLSGTILAEATAGTAAGIKGYTISAANGSATQISGAIIADGKSSGTAAVAGCVNISVSGILAAGYFKTAASETGMADLLAGLKAKDETVIQTAASADKYDAVSGSGTGSVTLEDGSLIFGNISVGDVTISTGARMYGNLTVATSLKFNIDALSSNVALTVTEDGAFGKNSSTYSIIVGNDTAEGSYSLVAGLSETALSGKTLFTISDTDGTKLGSLSVGSSYTVADREYTLAMDDNNVLTLNVAKRKETASLVVTTTEDVVDAYDGVTSLREAAAYANELGGEQRIKFDSALAGKTVELLTSLTLPSGCTITGTDVTISGKGLVCDDGVSIVGIKLDSYGKDCDSISITSNVSSQRVYYYNTSNIASAAVNGNATALSFSISATSGGDYYLSVEDFLKFITVTAEKGTATGISCTIDGDASGITGAYCSILTLPTNGSTMTVSANDGDAVGVTAVAADTLKGFSEPCWDVESGLRVYGVFSCEFAGTMTVTAINGNATCFLCPAGTGDVISSVSSLRFNSFYGVLTAASNQTATGISAKYFMEEYDCEGTIYNNYYPRNNRNTGVIIADGKNADSCAISAEAVGIYRFGN